MNLAERRLTTPSSGPAYGGPLERHMSSSNVASRSTDSTLVSFLALYPFHDVASLPSRIAPASVGASEANGLWEPSRAGHFFRKVARAALENGSDIGCVQQSIWCKPTSDLPSQHLDIHNHTNDDLAVAAFWQLKPQLVHVASAPKLQLES